MNRILFYLVFILTLQSCNSNKELMYVKCKNNSVNSFGAKGDGITDDTKAIQDAFYSGQAIIEFEAGATYLVKRNGQETLNINRSIIIKGNNATIHLSNDATGASIIKTTCSSNEDKVIIENLNFEGGEKTAYAIHITGAYSKVNLTNITTSNYSLNFDACASTLIIKDCHLGFKGGNSSPNISINSNLGCEINTSVLDCIVEYRKYSESTRFGIHFGNIGQNTLLVRNRVINTSKKFIDCFDLDGIGKNSIISENFSQGGSFNLKRIVNIDQGFDPVLFSNNICVGSHGPGFILRCPVNAYNLICEKAEGVSLLLLDDSKDISSPQRIIKNLQIINPKNTAIKINTDNVIIDGFLIKGGKVGIWVLPHENGEISEEINIINGVFEDVDNAFITHKNLTPPARKNISYRNVKKKHIHK